MAWSRAGTAAGLGRTYTVAQPTRNALSARRTNRLPTGDRLSKHSGIRSQVPGNLNR
jgi:hypothetical protein